MAKSKNHTNHNQNKKDHKNGIKKVPKSLLNNECGVDIVYLRNREYAKLEKVKQALIESGEIHDPEARAKVIALFSRKRQPTQ